LFIKKSEYSVRLGVNYRGQNEGIIKNRYPLPRGCEILNRLQKAKYFSTVDVRGAYNLPRTAKGEEWKTAFGTHYGLYESFVIPFGLTHAPADCQYCINDDLKPFLDVFCTVYIDDILIYSNSLLEHKAHVQ
jgi:hypothetical protein